MAQKVIRTEYSDGKVVLSNIRNNKGFPVFRENDTVTATKVTQWYDGSTMSPDKADGKVYLRYKSTGEYFLVNLPNWGETFLQIPNMARMRAMTPTEILLIKIGYYKGVNLLGYYAENGGDTPAPIEYYLSTTSDDDDEGSVIEVGEVKLKHEFINKVDISYFGAKENDISNTFIQNCENYCYKMNLVLDFGYKTYKINDTINLRCQTVESGCTLEVVENPDIAVTVNASSTVSIAKTIYLPNIKNIGKPTSSYVGVGGGVKVYDINSCFLFTKEISNFLYGLFMTASAGVGNVYNNVYLGALINNKDNLICYSEGTLGWVNQMNFIGGRLSKNSSEMGSTGIIRIDVIEGGSGYTNATVNFTSGGSGSGASATAVIENGVITGITLNNSGSGYNRTLSGNITGDGQGARIRVVIGEPNSTQIRLMENDYSINNIKFIGTSIEGDNVDRHVWCEGSLIVFDQCRWEANVPNIHFVKKVTDNSGSENTVLGGHGSTSLYVSVAGGGTKRNYIYRASRGTNIESFNQALRLRSTNGTSAVRVYGSVTNFMNRGITSQFDNQWSTDIGDFGYRGKHRDDAYPKIILDNTTGRINIGNGLSDSNPVILSGSGSPEGVVTAPIGSIYMNRSGSGAATLRNIWEKTESSMGNTGWRLIGVQPSATTTTRGIVRQMTAIADITTADATDEATAIALANENKAKINQLLASLRTAGILAT